MCWRPSTRIPIDWNPKSVNLASLASELNLGLDSFIFLDDNPKECAEVASSCPGVLSIALPADISELPVFLDHLWAFDHPAVTEEDRRRSELIAQSLEYSRAARAASSRFATFEEASVQWPTSSPSPFFETQ